MRVRNGSERERAMADFVTMIPSGGWRALLEMKDGSARDVPLVGWCLSENDIALPFFYPAGSMSAVELSPASVPDWEIASYRLYHPEERTQDAAGKPRPGVHLMVTDPADPEYNGTFTRCCGFNWRSVADEGLITGSRSLVTCTVRLSTA